VPRARELSQDLTLLTLLRTVNYVNLANFRGNLLLRGYTTRTYDLRMGVVTLFKRIAPVGIDGRTVERDAQCLWLNALIDRRMEHRERGNNGNA
jgi:hypothetical protein